MPEGIDSLLQPHRDVIAEADRQIAPHLKARHAATDEIGRIKDEHGVAPFVQAQHDKVLERLRGIAAELEMDPERLVGDYTRGILTQSVESQTIEE